MYMVTKSFAESTETMKRFANSLNRPFAVSYNPLTESIIVLDSADKLKKLTRKIIDDVELLKMSMEKLNL